MCLACAETGEERVERSERAAEIGVSDLVAFEQPALSVPAFRSHASALAHDSMSGRAPGTPGGEMAASYLAAAFRQAGLVVPNGSPGYRQEIPMRRARVRGESVIASVGASATWTSLGPDELIVTSGVSGQRVELDVRIEFVGHGVSSPGAGWNDYEGRDISGAFVAMLPGAPDSLVPRLDGGAAAYDLTYLAKVATVRRLGGRGIIHLTPPERAEDFASRKRMSEVVFPTPSWNDPGVVDFHATLGSEATAELLAEAGTDWEEANSAGERPGARFDRVLDFRLEFEQDVAEFTAPNIVGVVTGETDEIVVVTAHYDAYGIGPANAEGDTIYNGAADNAAGTAGLVELARAFAHRTKPPKRTVVFVATTAEEALMLGARYYVHNPVGALEAIVVNVNVDGLGFRNPTNDFALFPVDGTDALPTLQRLAEPLGMSFRAEPWHRGMHFNFDHAEFLARGIVGLTVWQGSDVRDEFRDAARAGGPIHTPIDEYVSDAGDAGIKQHLALYLAILEHYAEGGERPRFTAGHPFGNGGTKVRAGDSAP